MRDLLIFLTVFSGVTVLAAPADGAADAGVDASAPAACRDNLCGGDSYCSCHEVGTGRRCWTTEADCNVDRTCCIASGQCNGMVNDACTAKVRAERAKRK
jgi:hypothetical protein